MMMINTPLLLFQCLGKLSQTQNLCYIYHQQLHCYRKDGCHFCVSSILDSQVET